VTTTSKAVSPKARIARAFAQTAAGWAVAQPVIDSLVKINGGKVAWLSGIAASVPFLVSTVQNVLEHFGVIPTVGSSK
jgi:hypothetical protein